MPKSLSSREILKVLELAGFQVVRTGPGDHVQLAHRDGRRCTIVHPKKDIPIGTLKSIERLIRHIDCS